MQEEKIMLNVFVKQSAEELHIQLSDGRMMPLEDLVKDYERLLNEDSSEKEIKSELKDDKPITSKLTVGKWFRIDRDVINKSKEEIRRKCHKAGIEGVALWERFEKSNKIADENPNQYPRLIETYIFNHNWEYKTEQEMRYMCEGKGDGMCDEVICDLELQMRICNGESVDDLIKKIDKLPCVRVIKLRNGGTGYFGGGAFFIFDKNPPAKLDSTNFYPGNRIYNYTPYAFREKLK